MQGAPPMSAFDDFHIKRGDYYNDLKRRIEDGSVGDRDQAVAECVADIASSLDRIALFLEAASAPTGPSPRTHPQDREAG